MRLPSFLVSTVAGRSIGFANGIGTNAAFNAPSGAAVENGILFITDFWNAALRAVDTTTLAVTTIGTNIGGPGALSLDGLGTLFITSYYSAAIMAFDITSASISVFASNIQSANGVGPGGVVSDRSGSVYVSDTGNNRILTVKTDTYVVSPIAGGNGSYSSGLANGMGTAATFLWPLGTALGSRGLYISDKGNNLIRLLCLATPSVLPTVTPSAAATPSSSLTNTPSRTHTGTRSSSKTQTVSFSPSFGSSASASPTASLSLGAVRR